MALARYENPDPYTLMELKREYNERDCHGRIRLLRRLARTGDLHREIKQLAAEDEHGLVRQFVARFAYLDEELKALLKRDRDELVRASVWENASVHFWSCDDWCEAFKAASHLERLAMVRNRHVSMELVEKIFDLENQELELEMDKRRELACAFLTNEPALNRGQLSYMDWCERVDPHDAVGFLNLQEKDRRHFDKLWALASKWPSAPIELGVRYWVYRYVGADDKTKAETYRTCGDYPALRKAILRNTRAAVDLYGGSSSAEDTATIKLGLEDKDHECRHLAAQKAAANRRDERPETWRFLRHATPPAIGVMLLAIIVADLFPEYERALLKYVVTPVSVLLVVVFMSVLIGGIHVWTGAVQRDLMQIKAVLLRRRKQATSA
jgi:hypothetical protein